MSKLNPRIKPTSKFTDERLAEVNGFSEHFLTFIAAYEGIENAFDE